MLVHMMYIVCQSVVDVSKRMVDNICKALVNVSTSSTVSDDIFNMFVHIIVEVWWIIIDFSTLCRWYLQYVCASGGWNVPKPCIFFTLSAVSGYVCTMMIHMVNNFCQLIVDFSTLGAKSCDIDTMFLHMMDDVFLSVVDFFTLSAVSGNINTMFIHNVYNMCWSVTYLSTMPFILFSNIISLQLK